MPNEKFPFTNVLRTTRGFIDGNQPVFYDAYQLSPESTKRVLETHEKRLILSHSTRVLEVYFESQWWTVSRCDLALQVETFLSFYKNESADEIAIKYVKHARFGSHLVRRENGENRFLCFDSYTDG